MYDLSLSLCIRIPYIYVCIHIIFTYALTLYNTPAAAKTYARLIYKCQNNLHSYIYIYKYIQLYMYIHIYRKEEKERYMYKYNHVYRKTYFIEQLCGELQ